MTRRAIHTVADAIELIHQGHITEHTWCCPGSVVAFAIFLYGSRMELAPEDIDVELERYLTERHPPQQRKAA